jgi:hypothetical protein
MAIVRHLLFGLFFGIFLMVVAEISFASINVQTIQEDTSCISDEVDIEL